MQPDLDSSAAELLMGKTPSIPGQVLGHPGPPLTSVETGLEGLYYKSCISYQQSQHSPLRQ